MGTQRRRYRRIEWPFPDDFPDRLVRFQKASGLSTRALAGLLGVSPYRLRRWKRHGGDDPNPAHLFALLTIAEAMELRDGVLMCPEHDFPGGIDVEGLRARMAGARTGCKGAGWSASAAAAASSASPLGRRTAPSGWR